MLPDVQRGGAPSVTKFPGTAETNFVTRRASTALRETRSLQPAPNPSTPGPKRGRGRPRVHASPAARQRAYRARQKAA
jgi:hypothetical protein